VRLLGLKCLLADQGELPGLDQGILYPHDGTTDGRFADVIGGGDMCQTAVFAPVHQRQEQLVLPTEFGRSSEVAPGRFYRGQHRVKGGFADAGEAFEPSIGQVFEVGVVHTNGIPANQSNCKQTDETGLFERLSPI
jgi:hypothetical protein